MILDTSANRSAGENASVRSEIVSVGIDLNPAPSLAEKLEQ